MNTLKKLLLIVALINVINVQAQAELTNNIQSINDNGSLYWTGTALFSAINITTTYFNIEKWNKDDKYRSNAILGIVTGCAQTAFGVAFMNEKYNNNYIPTSINIGVGLTSITTSIIRLAKKNPVKQNSTSFNLMYLPNSSYKIAIYGFTFKKEL